jgi:hypothetical protein
MHLNNLISLQDALQVAAKLLPGVTYGLEFVDI